MQALIQLLLHKAAGNKGQRAKLYPTRFDQWCSEQVVTRRY